MSRLTDSCHRPINYLRISITDRCNLRCTYCMPEEGIPLMAHDDVLSYEEIITVARVAAELGITKIRLTGGEPLVRAGLDSLVARLAAINAIEDISLTTNGVLLREWAGKLRQAGLKRVNVSLDTLDEKKFRKITRCGKLDEVLQGIKAAREAGLDPVKINVVAMRGVNDNEIIDFARLTVTDGWHVRFIELMPFTRDSVQGSHSEAEKAGPESQFIPTGEIKECLNSLGKMEPVKSIMGNGPAKYFRLPGAAGTIGFISAVSQHFCSNCNRLRLTADGKLRPCLFNDNEINLREVLRSGAPMDKIREAIITAVNEKPTQHNIGQGFSRRNRFMSQVGG